MSAVPHGVRGEQIPAVAGHRRRAQPLGVRVGEHLPYGVPPAQRLRGVGGAQGDDVLGDPAPQPPVVPYGERAAVRGAADRPGARPGLLGRIDGVRRPGVEVPGGGEPVALVAVVHPVVHRPVQVDQVLGSDGAQLDQVEPGVAAHQRVERPAHGAGAVLQRPDPLGLLEREADPAVGGGGRRHERVRARVGGRPEDRDRRPREPLAARPGAVRGVHRAARVHEAVQHLAGIGRIGVRQLPHIGEEVGHRPDTGHIVHGAHADPGGVGGGGREGTGVHRHCWCHGTESPGPLPGSPCPGAQRRPRVL